MRRWITELVGTFSLVAVYAWAYAHTPDLAPLVIGGALALLVAGGARRSGAHFNPAISVAFLLRGRLAEGEALRYVAAQLGG
ncbi:MAG: aquaporin, partial [Myxococcales bacterium]|nr:aquaporin [Myxococcales bacterium]